MSIEKAAEDLQHKFAVVDLMTRPSSGRYTELLIIRLLEMKLKMYQENGPHKEPHIHIDYGNRNHIASYSIRSGERIVGNLDRKYDGEVSSWIGDHQSGLAELWSAMQAGQETDKLVAALQGEKTL